MLAGARTAAREARAVAIPPAVAGVRMDVAWVLGRMETKKFLLGPAFLATVGLVTLWSLVSVIGILGSRQGDGGSSDVHIAALVGLAATLAAMAATPIGMNAATVRADRSGLREQLGSMPTTPETRTFALAVALLFGPVLVISAVVAVAYPFFRDWSDDVTPSLVAQAPPAAMALGAMAIGIGRWIRFPIGGVLIVVLHAFTPLIWALPWIVPTNEGWDLGWHFGYLAGQTALWLSVALAGDRRRLTSTIAPLVCLGVVVMCAMQRIPAGGLP